MSSTNIVDFSIRQNKSIERVVVFENLRKIVDELSLKKLVYVGLGSVWFSDFLLAHRTLRIDTMMSVESNPVVYKRALFNKPYRTLKVYEGESATVLPGLLKTPTLMSRPWIVWLDYDKAMDGTRRDELSALLRDLPENSSLIVTCNAQMGRYQKLAERIGYLEELFDDAVPAGLGNSDVNTETGFMNILRETIDRFMKSVTLRSARPGGYESAFSIAYQDGTPMVTVGGFLPSEPNSKVAQKTISSKDWTGRVEQPIITPPLTNREVAVLQAQLPRTGALTRKHVQRLGFDLDEAQIASFVSHYLNYPVFTQVAR